MADLDSFGSIRARLRRFSDVTIPARLFAMELRELANAIEGGTATGWQRKRLKEMVEALKRTDGSREWVKRYNDQLAVDAMASLQPVLVAAKNSRRSHKPTEIRKAFMEMLQTLPLGAVYTADTTAKIAACVDAMLSNRGPSPAATARTIAILILGPKGITPDQLRQGARQRGAQPRAVPVVRARHGRQPREDAPANVYRARFQQRLNRK